MVKVKLKDRVYEQLKEKIIRSELRPGTYITEGELAEMTGASRTPIREALLKLEQEELVVTGSKKGILIAEITQQQIRDYFELRLLVEPHCIRSYADRISSDVIQSMLEQLRECKQRQDIPRAEELDPQLHLMLIRASNNDYLIRMMERIYLYGARMRNYSETGSRYGEKALDQHIGILECIFLEDYERAARMMEIHLKATALATYSQISGAELSEETMREYDLSNC